MSIADLPGEEAWSFVRKDECFTRKKLCAEKQKSPHKCALLTTFVPVIDELIRNRCKTFAT